MEKSQNIITGIADEASEGLQTQIEVHKSLGWNYIELRNIDGENISQLSDEKFSSIYRQLSGSDMHVIAFSSPIANWGRPITGDFKEDIDDLKRSIPRMHKLGTKYIRIMSYPNDGLPESEWERRVFKRIRELTKIAEDGEVILVHENCDGWASQSPENLTGLIKGIDSPSLRIVFDSGNVVAHGGSGADTWKFYLAAKPFIVHFHIKDCFEDKKTENGEVLHTYPGEGSSGVRDIIIDLLKSGYRGAFSIEPHIAVQIHLGTKTSEHPEAKSIYLEYGNRTNDLFKSINESLKDLN